MGSLRKTGTALEWFEEEPDAYIWHPELQLGTCLRVTEYAPKGRECEYRASEPDGEPWIWFGRTCPYLVRDKVQFFVHAVRSCSGGMTALSSRLAQKPGWQKIEGHPAEWYTRFE